MNAYVTGLAAREESSVSRAENILNNRFERPTLVIDTQAVARRYSALAQGLGRAQIHYAVKANPAPEILGTLVEVGSFRRGLRRRDRDVPRRRCDASSGPGPLATRSSGRRTSHGPMMPGSRISPRMPKKSCTRSDPARTGRAGLYPADRDGSLHADWPLFANSVVRPRRRRISLRWRRPLGLVPVGLSFHVGSQTGNAEILGPSARSGFGGLACLEGEWI